MSILGEGTAIPLAADDSFAVPPSLESLAGILGNGSAPWNDTWSFLPLESALAAPTNGSFHWEDAGVEAAAAAAAAGDAAQTSAPVHFLICANSSGATPEQTAVADNIAFWIESVVQSE